MRLFIAEKPSLGRAIADGLGGGQKGNGCIRCGQGDINGHTFVYSTPMNIPWMLAYRSGSHGLFGRKIADEKLRQRILQHESHARFNEREQLTNEEGYRIAVSFCFVNYGSELKDNSLNESMDLYVTQGAADALDVIFRQKIVFNHSYFQNLIHMPVDHPSRRMNLVEMARTLIRA